MAEAIELVVGNDDLLTAIFELARLTPAELVAVGRVCHQWRRVVHANAQSLVRAATPPVMTKSVLMGLYALTSGEADGLPHDVRVRKGGGYMCLYSRLVVADAAWGMVGSALEWEGRLMRRRKYQAALERTLGPDWRTERWAPYRHVCPPKPWAGRCLPARGYHVICGYRSR